MKELTRRVAISLDVCLVLVVVASVLGGCTGAATLAPPTVAASATSVSEATAATEPTAAPAPAAPTVPSTVAPTAAVDAGATGRRQAA